MHSKTSGKEQILWVGNTPMRVGKIPDMSFLPKHGIPWTLWWLAIGDIILLSTLIFLFL